MQAESHLPRGQAGILKFLLSHKHLESSRLICVCFSLRTLRRYPRQLVKSGWRSSALHLKPKYRTYHVREKRTTLSRTCIASLNKWPVAGSPGIIGLLVELLQEGVFHFFGREFVTAYFQEVFYIAQLYRFTNFGSLPVNIHLSPLPLPHILRSPRCT